MALAPNSAFPNMLDIGSGRDVAGLALDRRSEATLDMIDPMAACLAFEQMATIGIDKNLSLLAISMRKSCEPDVEYSYSTCLPP